MCRTSIACRPADASLRCRSVRPADRAHRQLDAVERRRRRCGAAYLRITYDTGAYRPYEDLVAEAAEQSGLDRNLALRLEAAWPSLAPWPDVAPVLGLLAAAAIGLGVVTNCSRRLGLAAAA